MVDEAVKMSERIIKTGLGLHYKDMLDAVIGQMSDGVNENIARRMLVELDEAATALRVANGKRD